MYFMNIIKIWFPKTLSHLVKIILDVIGWREIGANEDNYIRKGLNSKSYNCFLISFHIYVS